MFVFKTFFIYTKIDNEDYNFSVHYNGGSYFLLTMPAIPQSALNFSGFNKRGGSRSPVAITVNPRKCPITEPYVFSTKGNHNVRIYFLGQAAEPSSNHNSIWVAYKGYLQFRLGLQSVYLSHTEKGHVANKRQKNILNHMVLCSFLSCAVLFDRARAARALSWITWWAPSLDQRGVPQIEPHPPSWDGAAFKIDPRWGGGPSCLVWTPPEMSARLETAF